jgi:Ser/Thr protein kinase RdoA (MazF antagonist)
MPAMTTRNGESLEALAAAARAVLPRFGVAASAAVTLLHRRENAVFRIDDLADARPWALRVHRRSYRTTAEIRSEIIWMDALREAGIPTPRARPGLDGDPVQVVPLEGAGDGLAVDMFAWIDGRPLQVDDASECYALVGRTSALIQRHGRSWRPSPGFTRPVWELDALIGPRALWGDYAQLDALSPAALALVDRAAVAVRRRLDAFGRGPDRFGLTHGDLMPDNVLIEGGVPYVIDFDDSGFGWYLYDLATILAPVVGSPSFAHVRDAWIAGYRTVTLLPDEHVNELDALVMARLLLGLGWMHTRRETQMARDFTEAVVHLACVQAQKILGGRS